MPSFRHLTKLAKRMPLRAILIIPFVLQIVLVVGLTGYLSYLNGREAVKGLVNQLEQEVSNRVDQTLKTYLSTPRLVNHINADAIRLGLLNLEDTKALESYLWNQFQQFDDAQATGQQFGNLTFIGLATATGNYIDLGYQENVLQMSLRDQSQDGITRVWRVNTWGKRTKLLSTKPDYDPRRRPWYQAAVQSGEMVWVNPYLTVLYDNLVISADRPLYDRQGNLIGVADATLSLNRISQFLQNLRLGKAGQTFIVQPDGQLIGTSTKDKLFNGTGANKQRLNVIDSSNGLTRATAQYLHQTFGSFSNINSSTNGEFWLEGKRQFVKVQPFPGEERSQYQGLNWLVVVVIPEEEFMEQINTNTLITILLCLAALVIAVAFGIATSRWLTQPILQLSQAAEALASGDWDRQVSIQRSDELGTLAHAFNEMRQGLKHSHLQLEEYSRGLEQKNEQLETLEAELRRQLNLFLHAVSHDLRNPVLGTAMVLTNLSHQPGEELQLPRRILERMMESNQRQLDLINSLIDTHATEMWGIVLHPKPFKLSQLVQSAIGDLQPMLEKEHTVLVNYISPELPLVNVDPLQLVRVYQNLLANALKHNPPGLHLTLDAKAAEGWLHCTVADNGVGISPEQCEKLFDPYFRGNPKLKTVGLGLGLYLCQQIIQAHGGEIGVRSKLGQGTTFWFTLPISQQKSERELNTPTHG